ncbi:mucin-2-like, partial [Xyrauchen texanus]|uniref:mucin-2-like n=1 Tax=Xyrauchen texanus TaxID=154827 RepID=UPI00224242F2
FAGFIHSVFTAQNVCKTYGSGIFETFNNTAFHLKSTCPVTLTHFTHAGVDCHIIIQRAPNGLMDRVEIIVNKVITFIHNNTLTVEGNRISLPYDHTYQHVFHYGIYTKLRSKLLPLSVTWYSVSDGVSLLRVQLDQDLVEGMSGLCGHQNSSETMQQLIFDNVPADGHCLTQDSVEDSNKICSNVMSHAKECLGSKHTKYKKLCYKNMHGIRHQEANCSFFKELSMRCGSSSPLWTVWRSTSSCSEPKCPGDLQYTELGHAFPPTCTNPQPIPEITSTCLPAQGKVLNDHIDGYRSIHVEDCPCVHARITYLPGQERRTKCQTCTCIRGKWSCSANTCPPKCIIEGQFITTFDGKQYSLPERCTYVASRGLSWTLNIQFSRQAVAIEKAYLNINQERYTFSANSVQLNNIDISDLSQTESTTVFWQSSMFIQVQTSFGLKMQVQVSPEIQIYLTLPPDQTTKGLCGTFNNDTSDDFTTFSGIVESSVQLFAQSWSMDSCSTTPTCISTDNEIFAEDNCDKLRDQNGVFAVCHDFACVQRTCRCSTALNECLCISFGNYAKACLAQGITIDDWRRTTNCLPSCQGNLQFGYTNLACNHTCRSISGPDPTCEVVDDPVEGCSCISGTYLNNQDICSPHALCSCHHPGGVVPPGPVVIGRRQCMCENGQLRCVDVCDCPVGKICMDCSQIPVNTAYRTCDSLTKPLREDNNCISGCYCPEGLFEDHNGGCVTHDNCTCQFSGTVYLTGQSVETNCQICTCRGGEWSCIDEACSGACEVFGNGQYRTFDSKWYRFDGHCQYTLVKDAASGGHGQFAIKTESVPCCDETLTCSRAISVELLDEVILILSDMKVSERPLAGITKVLQAEPLYFINTVGLYIIISVPGLGFTVIWDKHTRVTIQLDSQWRGRVLGLCGNFDGKVTNDLLTSSSSEVFSVRDFGNSWKTAAPPCSDVTEEIFPCERHSYCAAWAQRRCMILRSDTFQDCHLKVDPEPYYQACVLESCSCEFEGKFLGFCTAVAAYAEACNAKDTCINWRTPDLCPVYCDYYNEKGQCSWHYDPCGQVKTCGTNNLFTAKLEGCYPRCPAEVPYYDENTAKCSTLDNCTCHFMNRILTPLDEFCTPHRCCKCLNGNIVCISSTTTTSTSTFTTITEPTNTTQPTTMKPTSTAQTTTSGSTTKTTSVEPTTPTPPTTLKPTTTTEPPTSQSTTHTDTTTAEPTTKTTTMEPTTTTQLTTLEPTTTTEPPTSQSTTHTDKTTAEPTTKTTTMEPKTTTQLTTLEPTTTTEPPTSQSTTHTDKTTAEPTTKTTTMEPKTTTQLTTLEPTTTTEPPTSPSTTHMDTTTTKSTTTTHLPTSESTTHTDTTTAEPTTKTTTMEPTTTTQLTTLEPTTTTEPPTSPSTTQSDASTMESTTTTQSPTSGSTTHMDTTTTKSTTTTHLPTSESTTHTDTTTAEPTTKTTTMEPTTTTQLTTLEPTTTTEPPTSPSTTQSDASTMESTTTTQSPTSGSTRQSYTTTKEPSTTTQSSTSGSTTHTDTKTTTKSTTTTTTMEPTTTTQLTTLEPTATTEPPTSPSTTQSDASTMESTTTTQSPTSGSTTHTDTTMTKSTITTHLLTSESTTHTDTTTAEPTTKTTTMEPTSTTQLTTLEPTTTTEPPTSLSTTQSDASTMESTTTTQSPTSQSTTQSDASTKEPSTTAQSSTSGSTTYTDTTTTTKSTTTTHLSTFESTTHTDTTTAEPTTKTTTMEPTTTTQPTTLEPTTITEPPTSQSTTQSYTTITERATTTKKTTMEPTTTTQPTTLEPTTTPQSPTSQSTTQSYTTTTKRTTTTQSPTSGSTTQSDTTTMERTTTTLPKTNIPTTTVSTTGFIIITGPTISSATTGHQIVNTTTVNHTTMSPSVTSVVSSTNSEHTTPVCECRDVMRNKSWPCGATWTEDCADKACRAGVIEVKSFTCPELKDRTDCPGDKKSLVKNETTCCKSWQCDCQCQLYGDPHYISFQGVAFDFLDNCTYTLVEERVLIHHFSITVDNYYCEPDFDASCTKGITLQFSNDTVTLMTVVEEDTEESMVESTLNQEIIKPPYDDQVFRFESNGGQVYVYIKPIRSYVSLTPFNTLVVNLAREHFLNNTQGQCGVCGGQSCIRKNGVVEMDNCCDKTAYGWVVDDPLKPYCKSPPKEVSCVNPTPTTPPPCYAPICDLLQHEVFAECGKTINLTSVENNCRFDQCLTNSSCSSLEYAASECKRIGICVHWRPFTNGLCEVKCPKGMIYDECRQTPNDVCQGGMRVPAKPVDDLRSGCFCPDGQVLAEEHKQICLHECPFCKGPLGEPMLVGSVWESNCHTCTCNNQTKTEVCTPKPPNPTPVCSPYSLLMSDCCNSKVCVMKTCEYNGTTYKVGDRWTDPSRPCESFSCTETGTELERRICPLQTCAEDSRVWDKNHCCYTCNVACTTRMTRMNVTVENCTQEVELPSCEGQCETQHRLVQFHGTLQLEQDYKSCKERSYEMREITLTCRKNNPTHFKYRHITGCECKT